jgi:hypothetical protein
MRSDAVHPAVRKVSDPRVRQWLLRLLQRGERLAAAPLAPPPAQAARRE